MDSTLIMQLLRDNLTLWTSDTTEATDESEYGDHFYPYDDYEAEEPLKAIEVDVNDKVSIIV